MENRIEVPDWVTTFEVEIDPPPLEERVNKFTGRKTSRTLQAARRMNNKKRVKVPRNLMREAYRLMGGWTENAWQLGNWEGKMRSDLLPERGNNFLKVAIGDLLLIQKGKDGSVFMFFRGYRIAYMSVWSARKKGMLNGMFSTLGEHY